MINKIHLKYVSQLAGDDFDFKKKFIETMLQELQIDLDSYRRCYQLKSYKDCAGYVHKTIPKISIIGLSDEIEFLKELESDLKENKKSGKSDRFVTMLSQIIDYLKNIES